jgi:hypothetical protein
MFRPEQPNPPCIQAAEQGGFDVEPLWPLLVEGSELALRNNPIPHAQKPGHYLPRPTGPNESREQFTTKATCQQLTFA